MIYWPEWGTDTVYYALILRSALLREWFSWSAIHFMALVWINDDYR